MVGSAAGAVLDLQVSFRPSRFCGSGQAGPMWAKLYILAATSTHTHYATYKLTEVSLYFFFKLLKRK